LQIEFSKTIQHITEDSGTEISPAAMWAAFQAEYLPETPSIALLNHEVRSSDSRLSVVSAHLSVDGREIEVLGTGNGPIEAFVKAVNDALNTDLDVVDYAEHALGSGKDATAVAYVETRNGDGQVRWGVGMDSNIMTASLRAVVSAFLRQGAAG
jgi:2-isopropylmalate synthase